MTKSSIRLSRLVCAGTLFPKMSLAPISAESSVIFLVDGLKNCHHITTTNEFYRDFELQLLLVCLMGAELVRFRRLISPTIDNLIVSE